MTSRRKGSSSIHLRRPCRVRMPAASALDRGGDSTDALLLVRVPEATIRQLRDRSMPQRPDLQRGGHSSRPPSPSPQHDHCSHHDHHAQPKQRAPRRNGLPPASCRPSRPLASHGLRSHPPGCLSSPRETLRRSCPRGCSPDTNTCLTFVSWLPFGAIPPQHARCTVRKQRVTCSVRREVLSRR